MTKVKFVWETGFLIDIEEKVNKQLNEIESENHQIIDIKYNLEPNGALLKGSVMITYK